MAKAAAGLLAVVVMPPGGSNPSPLRQIPTEKDRDIDL